MTGLLSPWTRRSIIKGAGSLAAAALAPASAFAGLKKDEARRCIDVHHHFMPQSYMKQEQARISSYSHGVSVDRLVSWSPEQSIEAMDRSGVDVAIGSVTSPGVWFGDVPAARRLSREWNEAAARAVQDYPRRFGFFALIGLPDVDGALTEVAYALDILMADGIALLTNYDGKSLGDPSFAPVLEELDRRKAVVYVHPTAAPCCAGLIPEITPQQIEFPLDTTRTITSLAVSGALARLKSIRWIFSHGGGTLPFLAARISAITRDKLVAARNPEGIEGLLKRLHCDTAGANSAPQLAAMTTFFPPTQILFGSDYPFVSDERGIGEGLEAIERFDMPPELRSAIYRTNALRLLPHLQHEV